MTRDPDRMEPLLAALLEAWRLQPDMRLTQLLWEHAAGPVERAPMFFYKEDDELLGRLQERTAAKRRALEDAQTPEMVEHMYDKQVLPQLRARRMREQGVEVEAAFVNVGSDAEGWDVTCLDCGRTSKLDHDPGVKVALCPDCQRKRGL